MKKLSFILFALLTTQAWALDSKDAGTYQMLNMQGKPTPVYMRYYQKGEQWVMDGKKKNEPWSVVCDGTGDCRLQESSVRNVQQWQKLLPDAFQNQSMECINNIAFAFCRTSSYSEARKYWWIPMMTEVKAAISLKRIGTH